MSIRTLVISAAAAVVAAGVVAPSAHALDDSTAVTVSLSGAGFSIDAPATATGSGTVTPLSSIAVSLSDTTVTDNRGTLVGWAATATSTGLAGSGAADGETIDPLLYMQWATGTIASPTNGLGDLLGIPADIAFPGAGPLGGAGTVAAVAATLTGGGVYTYPATVTVTVPLNAVAGSYTGTIVQTLV